MTQSPCLPELPKLPNPWTAASTLKCTACGAPYEPMRALPPMAGAGYLGGYVPAHACKCGNTQFGGTFGYDSPSPAQFTAAHMRDFATAHGLACYEAGSAAAAQAVVPAWELRLQGAEAFAEVYGAQDDWRSKAAAWLRRKADEQERTNREFPKHVEAYPSWADRPRQFRWLADDLDAEAAAPTQGAEGAAPQAVDDLVHRIAREHRLYGRMLTSIDLCKFAHALFAAAPREADALREALKLALKALEAIGDEMTVGERYTNAGQYLLDALEPARAALAQHQPQQGEQK